MYGKAWLIFENVPADILSLGAYASRLSYSWMGQEYEVFVDNKEFLVILEVVNGDDDEEQSEDG